MNFKKWLNESVTFTIKDYSKQKIDDIYNLAYIVNSELRKSLGIEYNAEGFKHSRLDIDGLETPEDGWYCQGWWEVTKS